MSQHQLKLIAEKANNCIKDLIIKRAISANSNFRISLSRLFAAEIKIGIYFNEIVGIANMGSENRTNICWSYWRSNMQWIIIIHFQIRMPFFENRNRPIDIPHLDDWHSTHFHRNAFAGFTGSVYVCVIFHGYNNSFVQNAIWGVQWLVAELHAWENNNE